MMDDLRSSHSQEQKDVIPAVGQIRIAGNQNLWVDGGITTPRDTTKITRTYVNPTLWILMEKSTGNPNLRTL